LGVVQLVLLARGGTFGAATDAYFFLFGLSMLPTQVLLAGVLYPMLLNEGGARPRQANRLRWGTPFLSVGCVGIGIGVLAISHRELQGLGPTMVLLAVNGALSATLWFDTLWLAARGRATWYAAVALPANAVACVALLPAWEPPTTRVAVMTGALVAGNVAYLAFLHARELRVAMADAPVGRPQQATGASWWFTARSAAGYAGGSLLQAFALSLPASAVTTVSIITRIVGSSTTTLVNAALPRYVHMGSEDPEPAFAFVRRFLRPLGLAFGVSALVAAAVDRSAPASVALVLAWAIATFTNAVVQQLSFRFLPPARARTVLVTVGAVLAGMAVVTGFGQLTLHLLLFGFVALDLVPAVAMARHLRRPSVVLFGTATLALALLVVGL
jgi:hypothetical protein